MLGSVGVNIFLFFFWKAIKIAGSAPKTGSVGLAETQVFYFSPNVHVLYTIFDMALQQHTE